MTARLLIEGPSAADAAADLVGTSGLDVDWRVPVTEGPEKVIVTLSAIATIMGIAVGTATAADLLIKWRDRWRDRRRTGDDQPVAKIVIEINDRRVLFDGLSAAEIAQLLNDAKIPPFSE